MSNLPSGLKRKIKPAAVIVRETSASTVLSDALSIVNNEIQRMKVKSSQGFGMDLDEVKILRTHIQSLVDLSKEQREQEKHDGTMQTLENMTPQELLEYYEQLKLENP